MLFTLYSHMYPMLNIIIKRNRYKLFYIDWLLFNDQLVIKQDTISSFLDPTDQKFYIIYRNIVIGKVSLNESTGAYLLDACSSYKWLRTPVS